METANFASGKLWSVSKPKIKKKGPDTGPFGYFLDFFIFFFGAILVGVSTAVPVAVEPGWSTPTPVDPGCGAEGFAPDCANAVDIEKLMRTAAKTSFFTVVSGMVVTFE
jgi:hypothetical protein